MNRNFLLAIASIAILASVACKVETTDTDGTGGTTSTSSTSTGTGGDVGGAGGVGGSSSGTAGEGGTADPCVDCVLANCYDEYAACANDATCAGTDCSCCAAAITDDSCTDYTELGGVDPSTGDCDGAADSSCTLYDTLGACVCGDACLADCGAMCG